jgi:hypothetical protein
VLTNQLENALIARADKTYRRWNNDERAQLAPISDTANDFSPHGTTTDLGHHSPAQNTYLERTHP